MDQPSVNLSRPPEASGHVSIPQAARALGLDTYTLYTLIQRERINPTIAAGGEFVVTEEDVKRLATKS